MMINPVSVLCSLREQGTIVRAERTTRVLSGVVQPYDAIVYRGRMPSPVEMGWVRRFREPILALLKQEGCIDEESELVVTFDYGIVFIEGLHEN